MQKPFRVILRAAAFVTLALVLSACGIPWTPFQPTPISLPASGSLPALDDVTAGLDQLQSYRLDLQVHFTGKNEQGQDFLASIETHEEKVAAEDTRHFMFLSNGQTALPAALEYYQVGGKGYTLSTAMGSNPTCMEVGAESFQYGSGLALLPQEVFQNNASSQRVAQGEVVNGIASDHYHIQQSYPAQSGLEKKEGDLWVAQQGGYIVRFSGFLQGQVALSDINGQGVIGWDYNLTDANQVSSIAIPEECQSQSEQHIPIPDSAQSLIQTNTLISFTTPDGLESVVDFYRQGLPEQGWNIDQEGSNGQVFDFSASHQGQTITIMIAVDSDVTRVTIQK